MKYLYLLLQQFVTATAYHFGQYKPSDPFTIQLDGLAHKMSKNPVKFYL